MGRFVDLSGWIDNGMWSYFPEYPGACISECRHPKILPSNYELYCQTFLLGGQTGTYIETHAHVRKGATPLSACPLDSLVMPATVVRLKGKSDNSPILPADIEESLDRIQPEDAVILATGWDAHWDEARRFVEGSPYITAEAARLLFQRGIRCLAADFPRFDYLPNPCFPWGLFWQSVRFLLAPVCNVYEGAFTRGRLYAFPLKIRGAMGSPVRAALEVEDESVSYPRIKQ
jgi:arylformamidase